jgi:dipeptidase
MKLVFSFSLHPMIFIQMMSMRIGACQYEGGRIWFGNHAPHGTCYAPFYSAASNIPDAYQTGHTDTWAAAVLFEPL